jgi:glutamyl-Q tRNA(Asp) synthetase
MTKYNTRFAPSPNGYLHLGHAFSAKISEGIARNSSGKFFLRIEDIDTGRCNKEFEKNIHDDLSWLGIKYQSAVIRQSDRFKDYEIYIKKLRDLNLIYPCWATRSEIKKEIKKKLTKTPKWPIDPDGQYIYPGVYKNISKAKMANLMLSGLDFSWRLNIEKAIIYAEEKYGDKIYFYERGLEPLGKRMIEPALYGDFIIGRKEIPTSYHLSVTVDDAEQNINLVTRGVDLYAATSIHRLLQVILNLPQTEWYHHELIREENGIKLSKTNNSTSIKSLREKGFSKDKIFSMISETQIFSGLI